MVRVWGCSGSVGCRYCGREPNMVYIRMNRTGQFVFFAFGLWCFSNGPCSGPLSDLMLGPILC